MTRERLIVAAASALVLFLTFFRGATPIFPFDIGSNGVFFDQAARVLAGEVMYRDFFEFVGPGVVYLHALALLVAGPNIRALTTVMVLQGAVLAVLVHALAAIVALGILDGLWVLVVCLAAGASLVLLGLFYRPWLTIGLVIDVVLLWAVLVWGFVPPSSGL